jgi:hypothetical protein
VVSPAAPTVGDTVTLERLLVVEDATAHARVGALEPPSSFESLHAPIVEYLPEGIRIRYIVAVFDSDSITMPDIELLFADGRVERVPGGRIVVEMQSVLPGGREPDSLPEARASQAPIARPTTDVNLLIGPVVAVLLLTALSVLIRRRPRHRPEWAATKPVQSDPPAPQWIAAGEPRAVAAYVMSRVRLRLAEILPEASPSLSVDECLEVIAAERPDWPVSVISDLLHSLERSSFAPTVPQDILTLVDEVERVIQGLGSPAVGAA